MNEYYVLTIPFSLRINLARSKIRIFPYFLNEGVMRKTIFKKIMARRVTDWPNFLSTKKGETGNKENERRDELIK